MMKSATAPLVSALCLLFSMAATAADPAPSPEQIKSSAWWRQEAVRYADKIPATDRGYLFSDLSYVQAQAGDLDAASLSATKVNDLQLRVYAYGFLAKQYKEKGNAEASRLALQEARRAASRRDDGSARALISAYLESGNPSDAIAFAGEISEELDRNAAFADIAVTLAQQGKLDAANDVVKRCLSAGWQQSTLLRMADACARELRIEDAAKLAGQLTKEADRDRIYDDLVDALVKAHRAAEAKPFADRIAVWPKGAAQAKIAGELAKGQSVEVIAVSIQKSTNREEKLALYDTLIVKLADAGKVVEAEAAIESMVKAIEASPGESQEPTFGTYDDSVAIVQARVAYLRTASVLSKQGDRKAALERIARVHKAIADLPEQFELAKIVLGLQLNQSQIDIGDLAGLRDRLNQMKHPYERSEAATQLAVALIKSGDVKAGIEIAQKTMYRFSRDDVSAFRAAGVALMESGHGEELNEWLAEMPSDIARAHACLGAAEPKPKK